METDPEKVREDNEKRTMTVILDDDYTKNFFNDEDFAEEAVIGGTAVTVIFDKNFNSLFGVPGNQPVLWAKSEDVEDVAIGTAVVVQDIDYTVSSIEPDGTGVTKMELQET